MRVTPKKLGIRASKDLTTVGGTPSGIFIVHPLRTMATNKRVAINATIIPKNKPLEPIHFKGKLVTS